MKGLATPNMSVAGQGRVRWQGRAESDGRAGQNQMAGQGRVRWQGRAEADGRGVHRAMQVRQGCAHFRRERNELAGGCHQTCT